MEPKIYSVDDHDIDPQLIDRDALTIMQRLHAAGHTAYLVGGSVRDLLVKRRPKDYDISTSAKPEEIKSIFQRNCLLIGRRFRLAHVRFGNKIFEVSTFRSGDNESDLIVQDNVWGTPEEDVLRRDFTINGLFYDPLTHTVIDYVGGWQDIHQGVLKTIGEPAVRFKQDPVRMIRLLKFRARFNFEIDPPCRKALIKCKDEIVKSSQARILEEILRMLESGAAAPFFMLLFESGVLDLLLPCLHRFLEGKHGSKIYQYLAAADDLNKNSTHLPLDRSVLTACLFYPMFEQELKLKYLNKGVTPHLGEIASLSASFLKMITTSSFVHFTKKISSTTAHILGIQFKLTPLNGKRQSRNKWLHDHDFKLALILLKIRALVNPALQDSYDWWRAHYKQRGTIQKPSHHTGDHHHQEGAVRRRRGRVPKDP